MKRSEANNKYKWNFSNLYKTNEEWKDELANVVKLAQQYKTFEGRLNEKETFFAYLDLEHKLDIILNKMVVYLHYGDTNQSDENYQVLESLLMNEWQKINTTTAFIAPELKEIGLEVILNWLDADPKYKSHKYGFEQFFKEAQHVLNQNDESLLSKVQRSRGAISGMYDALAYADRKEEEIDYKGKTQPLTTTLMTQISEDSDPLKDQELRIKASQIFAKNFSEKKHSFAKIYEGILQTRFESVQIRNYNSIIESSLIGDGVDIEIYKKLLEVGKATIEPFKEYNLLVKDFFKFDKFYATDRSLKLVKEYEKTFMVDEAKEIIKKALSKLGDNYLSKLNVAWSDNRIDYFEDTNKRDGAYSTGGNGVDPIILMNWDDKLNSVNTLAHEIGHSVHTLFAEEFQPYPLNSYPIILAEVASTINEHLLFDYLYNNSTDKNEKIHLLQNRISDLCGTFYRQIQFASFEYEASLMVEQGTPLTADALSDLFDKSQTQFGYDVFDKLSSESKSYGWLRISHFFHSPFYVYKYAVDVTASFKLYDDIKKGNIDSTINFLKAGGHKEPLAILKDVGVDFTKTETYDPLINGIKGYIKELKELLQN